MSVVAPPDRLELPAAVEACALRIIQEAVNNVRRHAAASCCEVTIVPEADTLSIEIVDDGIGFARAAARRDRHAIDDRASLRNRGKRLLRFGSGAGHSRLGLASGGPMTRVVVVDDHPVFRSGIAALLEVSGYEVVGEAAGAAEAVELVRRLRPAIVLMDLGLPDGSGVTATERIVAEHPEVRVVVVTMFDDDGSVRAALGCGCSRLRRQGRRPRRDRRRRASRRAGRCGAGVRSRLRRASGTTFAEPVVDPFGLTRRERQVLDLVVRGLTNGQIAERLGLSGKTVSNIVSTILGKMGVHDRVEAAALAREVLRTGAPPWSVTLEVKSQVAPKGSYFVENY